MSYSRHAQSSSHSSRRTNQSVSSVTSATSVSSSRSERSERSERSARSGSSPAVETAVTRLLVSIKQLLESLTKWSRQEIIETEVSDVYVRLGNDFNAAVAAFAAFNIQMHELMTVPDELRNVLETCLSEDATPENLDIYLPEVRRIITNLLQGLRGKQTLYRSVVSDHRQRSSGTAAAEGEHRSRRGERGSKRESDTLSRTPTIRSTADAPDSVAKRTVSSSGRRSHSQSASTSSETYGSPREGQAQSSRTSTPSHTPSRSQTAESSGCSPSRARSASAVDALHTNGYHPEEDDDTTPKHHSLPEPESEPMPNPHPPQQVPSHVKRYSLVDRPVSSPTPPPTVIIDEAPSDERPTPEPMSPAQTPPELPSDNQTLETPGVQNSLAALRNRDALERRASKRFSTYNISKMTGGSGRERPSASSNLNRRSLAVSSALSPGELAVLTEADEDTPTVVHRKRTRGSQRSRNPSPIHEEDETPPVPPLPIQQPSLKVPSLPIVENETSDEAPPPLPAKGPTATPSDEQAPTEYSPRSFPVFLQVGREVKKAMLEPGLSVSSLRVLFVDKFAYNPGQDNFPAIYIRDPQSGVQYELEDMDEIQPKCLLSLNIEPLDQIKQHIDSQISSLSQDIKDLRTMVASNRRTSNPPPPMIIAQPLAENAPATARPTDRQFRHIARRLSRFLPDDAKSPVEEEPVTPQHTGTSSIQVQMTGTSVMSEFTTRVVSDLKTQFDEVQNLRRDLGIMRQMYTEFIKQTKESLGALRSQTQNVRQLATQKVGGARAYINDGKAKLDSRSQNVLTKMEELQDTVESIKDDVLKRNISPKPHVLKNVKGDMEAVATELQSLKEHIQTVKPMWKKTWEEELQNIVEEQQFLQHQEEFLSDLLEDQKAVVEVYGHVEKVISLRGSAAARASRSKSFRPPPMDEGHTGLSTVMLEIRGAAVDPERRMKAIAANEKIREKELASRSDEFQSELSGFVGGKKLKMTGGTEETERVRQKRNEQTLKAMFGPSSGTASPMSAPNSMPSSPVTSAPISTE
ncbi:AIP3-domain-containing protein [Laetiporus sulphureus 93-53]|uniref:AIP3-domain-containing protein n=1 Tax=Laetiporus sulphureus 93-53 TaxID=1314785 RepID=A0A165EMF3_9APHY|nr:AIP3-domain-containing protein [Laetiporus sulphureus 93-53]KZT07366.1 AIP3-domain-containing protein [Laetiporus sulphureus 93-53]